MTGLSLIRGAKRPLLKSVVSFPGREQVKHALGVIAVDEAVNGLEHGQRGPPDLSAFHGALAWIRLHQRVDLIGVSRKIHGPAVQEDLIAIDPDKGANGFKFPWVQSVFWHRLPGLPSKLPGPPGKSWRPEPGSLGGKCAPVSRPGNVP